MQLVYLKIYFTLISDFSLSLIYFVIKKNKWQILGAKSLMPVY